MDATGAARPWADTWATAWPAQDTEAIVALQSDHGRHRASMFRTFEGKAGLRQYLQDAFAEETEPCRAWFAEPIVQGQQASVEYWAQCMIEGNPMTISGCTVLTFDDDGLVVEARDYSHVEPGDHEIPTSLARQA